VTAADDRRGGASWTASVADVDLDALAHNAALARRLAGRREVIGVVKADAYGHGAVPVARALRAAGCGRLAVLTVDEAVALRDAAIDSPILVLRGALDPQEAGEVAARGITPVVHSEACLERLAGAARRDRAVAVHVEVDTGMRRMGVAAGAAVALIARAASTPGISLEGVLTHFARADEPDPAPSLEQLAAFRGILEELDRRGVRPPCVHAANSAGLLSGAALDAGLPEATAVRPGLMLYGVHPAPHFDAVPLRPVMTLRARVVGVQSLAPGDAVGYGATFRAPKALRIATLPLGYADGVPWTGGNSGQVWLAGALRPIVGRVSMDYTSVRVDDAPVAPGDEAVFFGATGEGLLPVEQAAALAGTLSYEMLVRVGRRVPRRYLGGAFDFAASPR